MTGNEEMKQILFEVADFHSHLAEAEYKRNPSFNDSHPAHILEEKLIAFLTKKNLLIEFLTYLDNKDKQNDPTSNEATT